MKSQVMWASLPKTFQDAVRTARELGLNYLWIDSLCIIQDDPEDWEREAVSMADIYGRATITITATSASNCMSGFLQDLNRDDFSMIKLQLKAKTWDIYVRPSHNHDRFGFGKANSDSAVPLRSRAWAFQEYLLSPRSLQFGPTEMVWECNEHIKCECGAGFQKPNNHSRTFMRIKAQYKNLLTAGPRDRAHLQEFWPTLVRDYSSKKLTYDSDRLIALAGVRKQVETALNLRCHAGLWLLNPPQDLSWRTAFCTPGRRPDNCRAPTWSWASVEHNTGIVYALQIIDNFLYTKIIAEAHREPNPSGGVIEYLKIYGFVIDATLRRIGPDGPTLSLVVERDGARIPVYPDVADEGVDGETVSCLVLGKTKDRCLMLVCKKAEDGTGRYKRLGTTGSSKKSRNLVSFLALGNLTRRILTII